MIKVALTHDVDRTKKTYHYVTGIIKALSKGDISKAYYHFNSFFGKEPYWDIYEIAEIEKSYGLRSSFYMLDESIRFNPFKPSTFVLAKGRYDLFEDKIQEAIRYLDANGWEIGLHGSFNSYNNKNLLKKEKDRLESILEHKVIGTRQHHLNLDEKITWKIQEELGFKYDSTWGDNYGIGFRDNRINPFYPNNSDFKVFPLVIMDFCFMKTKNKWDKFNELVDIAEKNNAVLVVNYHTAIFNEKEFPGYKSSYIKILEESIKRGARIGPLCEFLHEK